MSLKQDSTDINKFERYLLGEMSRDEAFEFECEIFPDEEAAKELDVARVHLTECYLNGELNASQLDRFRNHFLSFPYNADLLRFQDLLAEEAESRQDDEMPILNNASLLQKLRDRFSFGILAVPTFAALLLTIIGGVIWLNLGRKAEVVQVAPPESRPTPIESVTPGPDNRNGYVNADHTPQQNKTPAETPITPKQMLAPQVPRLATISVTGSFRASGNVDKPIVLGRETRSVVLEFLLPEDSDPKSGDGYRIIVETMGGESVFSRKLEKAQKSNSGRSGQSFSPNVLNTGQYRFRLTSLSKDGTEKTVQSETFYIRRID